jgi:hypothetical protein
MNYKKIIILPALFILSNVLYIGCCKCEESIYKFYDITNLFVSLKGSGNAIIDTGKVTMVDTIFINSDIYRDCAARNNSPFDFLSNEAMALSCNCLCGQNGLKNEIDSILITSDSVYNNISANTALNSLFTVKESNNSFTTLDSYKSVLNNSSYLLPNSSFITTIKPNNTRGHIFNVKFKFTNGKVIEAKTKRIFWQ